VNSSEKKTATGALWATRYLTGGELVINRAAARRNADAPRWKGWFRRVWRTRQQPARPPQGPTLTPETLLAMSDATEARVAAAASRAWLETIREPSWQSRYLAETRAAFDGHAQVNEIIDLALRLHETRLRLGSRPEGTAAEYWDRQQEALQRAAHRLGDRADALIHYRDQAAQLSTELQHLADLERLEHTAAEVDGLTVQTAYGPGRGGGGISSVADQIAGVRLAMTELVDLMTRTRAPLAEPPQPHS
jgi:hypothetical protein